MTKTDIISGFLGAGKTTLIKRLLETSLKGKKVVLIENEFGEIGIDGGFLKDAGIEIREMNSGCICCSLVGDFGTALRDVVNKYEPDRILIEPSGVGKLSDVIAAVQRAEEEAGLKLNSYTTVVDAKKFKLYMKNFGEFFENQIKYAGAIIMSRTDIVDEAKAAEVMEQIRAINPDAVIISTPISRLDGDKLLEVMENPVSLQQQELEREVAEHEAHHHHHHHHDHDHEEHEHEHHHHHDHDEHGHEEHEHEHHHHHDHDDHDHEEHEHHHGHDHEEHEHQHHHDHDHDADEIFTSWGHQTVKKYSREELEKIISTLDNSEDYGMILRAKGMLEGTDGRWMYFDMVPGETEVRDGEPDVSGRFCVIGSELKEDKLAELFGI